MLHLVIPNFPVAVERLHDARLTGKPVVIGGFSGRARVSSCSLEALQSGIRPGMKLSMAKRLLPEVVLLMPDPHRYEYHSEAVQDVVARRAPIWEPQSLASYFVDLTGMERFLGCEQWTEELQAQLARDTRLFSAAGRSVNKLVSELAAMRTAPLQQRAVAAPEISPFLAPTPLRALPLIQPQTLDQLSLMGVQYVAQLREVSARLLVHVFGQKEGNLLAQFAEGKDYRSVQPLPVQSHLRQQHRFEGDTLDIQAVQYVVRQLAERLALSLRKQQNTCVVLHVRLSYSDHGRVHRQQKFAHPHAHTRILAQRAEALFKQIPLRRVVIREVSLEAQLGGKGSLQPSLFPSKQERLDHAIDALHGKRGEVEG